MESKADQRQGSRIGFVAISLDLNDMTMPIDAEFVSDGRGPHRRLPIILGLLAVSAITALGFRATLVRHAPKTAVLFDAAGMPVSITGLALDRVSARIVADGDRRILIVEGDVVNTSDRDEPARPLSVAVRGDRDEALYSWISLAPQQKIAPGERAAFVARLASPPAAGAVVVVEFDRSEERQAGRSRGNSG